MARGGSGSTRGAESQEMQKPPRPLRPSLQAIARAHSGSKSSLDIHMADVPAQAPMPRAFRSSSLPDIDLEQVGQLTAYLAENPNAYESHVQLIKVLYRGLISHIHPSSTPPIENDPRAYDLLGDLQQAIEAMASRFTVGEEVWVERLQAQELLARTVEDCLAIIELYEKAIADEVASTKLWEMYGEWMLSLYSAANPTDQTVTQMSKGLNQWMRWSEEDQMVAAEVFSKSQLLEVWKRGAEDVKFNLSESHVIWNKYTDLLQHDLDLSQSKEAVDVLNIHFVDRLQTPHSKWDETFQRFSSFVSKYDNAAYEDIMSSVNSSAAAAKSQFEVREAFELKLSRASESRDKSSHWTLFNEYLDWEMSHNRKKKTFNFDLTNALFQRAVLQFPTDANLWEDYLALLSDEEEDRQQSISALSILGRACGHCPWSGTLWSHYIQAAERSNLPFADIGQIKHKATSMGLLDSSKMEDVLKIHTAWCSFLRRRAFTKNATEEDPDVAEVGILSAIEDMEGLGEQKYGKEYQGDPQYRLERIYIKFLDQSQKYDQARERWKKLLPRRGNSYEFWLRYYWWEMIAWGKLAGNQPSSIPREATMVLQQAAKRSYLDWPEKILDTYLHHCEDHEDANEIQKATAHWRKAMKAVAKRREKEAIQAAEYAEQQQQQMQQHNNAAAGQSKMSEVNVNGSKRKRGENEETDPSNGAKKSRTSGANTEEVDRIENPTQPEFTRDRENTTVIVKNLPGNTQEKWIRSFFNDVRTLIDISPVLHIRANCP